MTIRIDGSNTAANPGITGADADTGLQFGTDEVKIVTGGVERVTVDGSGRLGIGTTSPGSTLEVDRGGLARSWTPNAGTYGLFIGGGTNYFSLVGDSGADLLFGSGTSQFLGRVRYENSTNALSLWTNNQERARIDSSGRLLVGTSIANPGLDGVIHTEGDIALATGSNTPSNSSKVSLGRRRGSSAIVAGNDVIGEVASYGWDGSTYIHCTSIKSEVDGTPGANVMPGRLVFSVTGPGASSPTERLRIGSDGKFTHYTYADFQISNFGTSPTSNAFVVRNGATGTGTGTAVCQIREDGDIENTNNSYGAISDAKLKENILDASSQWDDIKSLQVRKYNFKPETGYGTHTQIGLVAQEVELVSPGLVETVPDLDEDGNELGTTTKSVNYSVLYMKAVKALQEAMEKIETLEAQNAQLDARLTALEGGNP